MPSVRTNPPERDTEVTITRSCVAEGEKHSVGNSVKLSKTVAMELIANGQAVAGATKVTKKKAAKAKPVVNAER